MNHPEVEAEERPLRVGFDRRLRSESRRGRIISDAGPLASRGLDDALGLAELAAGVLSDGRQGKDTHHPVAGLVRQAMFGRLAGPE